MPITLNNLAIELMNWCASEMPKETNYSWNDEDQLMTDFTNYLNKKSTLKAAKGMPATASLSKNHLFLSESGADTNEGIIVEFLYDGNKKPEQLFELVNETSVKLDKKNLEESFQSSIRCIVSIYNDLSNRRNFHDIEFIEVFNDFGVGCAIKRIQ
ncbi:MAG: hypothetical protein PF517_10970 [Salinivirgaceae bacterium]|jgi:hypothetical protein|nr:hypothetical protein [Salinivirgaceae bacterium]